MSRLTRDGAAKTVYRDQILRRERGQGNINFPCSADHEQDWQPYSVHPYSSCTVCDDHTTYRELFMADCSLLTESKSSATIISADLLGDDLEAVPDR